MLIQKAEYFQRRSLADRAGRSYGLPRFGLSVCLLIILLGLGLSGVMLQPVGAESPGYDLWYVVDMKTFTSARVNLTVTIHSTGQTLDSFGFIFVEHVSNPSAYDITTGMALPVSFTSDASGNYITIQFTSPKGDGYKFVLVLDLADGWNFGTSGTNYFVSWGWKADMLTPLKVTVILPLGSALVQVEGPVSNQTSSLQSGRAVVSFSGTAVPGTYFKWIVVYTAPLTQNATEPTIMIDGLASDWKNFGPVIQDSQGDSVKGTPGTDLKAVYAVADQKTLYVMIELWGTPDAGNNHIFPVDTNGDGDWDFSFGFNRNDVWMYDLRGIPNLQWPDSRLSTPLNARYAVRDVAEIAVPLEYMETPTQIHMQVWIYYPSDQSEPDATNWGNVPFLTGGSVTSISTTRTSSVLQTQNTPGTGLAMLFSNLELIGIGAIVAVVASILLLVRREKMRGVAAKQGTALGAQFKKGVASSQPIVTTGYPDLDEALKGGVPEGFAVVIVSGSYDERDLLLRRIIDASISSGRAVFYISNDLGRTQDLITRYREGFHGFSSQADKGPSHPANLYKIPGIENLSDANISLNIAIRDARAKEEKARRPVMIIDILTDVLLRHKLVTTRRWLSEFVGRQRTEGFTVIACLNPLIGTKDETEGVIDFFDGVFEVYEKPLQERRRRFLVVRKMYGRDYSDNELLLDRQKLL